MNGFMSLVGFLCIVILIPLAFISWFTGAAGGPLFAALAISWILAGLIIKASDA